MVNASPIRCLITAGPTREYLDPVRFLSNPSTGKMGFALARAAVERGWTVDLVTGPVDLPEPDDVVLYPVTTAEEMFHQVDALFDVADILMMTAAVSDFRPTVRHPEKVKKEEAATSVEFTRTRDILATMTERKTSQLVVGFAAETSDLEKHARQKMTDKRLDFIAANDVSKAGSGFAGDENTILLLGADGSRLEIGPETKDAVAFMLVRQFAEELAARREQDVQA